MIQLYMLDTNTVSYVVKGKSLAARSKLAALHDKQVGCISAITAGEIHYGLAKMPNASTRRAAIESFLAKIQILPWGTGEALVYGELRAKQEVSGKTLESLDMLIAAHAVAANAVLVTSDKAFLRVKELLKVVNWATDL